MRSHSFNFYQLVNSICLFLLLSVVCQAANSETNDADNGPSMQFVGEWKTKSNASPKISITFSNHKYLIRVDDKVIDMTGGRLAKPAFPAFFHFEFFLPKGKYKGESYIDIGLVNGMIANKEVLSGFYSEIDLDGEGEIRRGNSVPVILYAPTR